MSRIRTQALIVAPAVLFAANAFGQEPEPQAAQDDPTLSQESVVDTPVDAVTAEKPVVVEYAEVEVVKQPEAQVDASAQPAADVVDAWNANAEDGEALFPWKLEIGGYIRTMFQWIADDPNNDIYGRNDGFAMANARLTIDGKMKESLGFRLQLDGSVDTADSEATRPVGHLSTQLRDGFIWWAPTKYTRLNVGQFKPPFDAEEATSRAAQLFIANSVGSEGVSGVEGYNLDGLSRDREAGAMLDTQTIYFQEDGLGLRYALATTNGSSASLTPNDNDALAFYGRLEFHYGKLARLGAAAYMNNETLRPEAADNVNRDVLGWTADLTVNAAGVSLLGNVMQATHTYTDVAAQPEVSATAYQVSLAYQEPFFGFQPTVRYAFYDPSSATSGQSSDLLFEADERTFYTIGLNYNPRYPVRVLLNYTITAEGDAVALENDRFEALLQLSW